MMAFRGMSENKTYCPCWTQTGLFGPVQSVDEDFQLCVGSYQLVECRVQPLDISDRANNGIGLDCLGQRLIRRRRICSTATNQSCDCHQMDKYPTGA